MEPKGGDYAKHGLESVLACLLTTDFATDVHFFVVLSQNMVERKQMDQVKYGWESVLLRPLMTPTEPDLQSSCADHARGGDGRDVATGEAWRGECPFVYFDGWKRDRSLSCLW